MIVRAFLRDVVVNTLLCEADGIRLLVDETHASALESGDVS